MVRKGERKVKVDDPKVKKEEVIDGDDDVASVNVEKQDGKTKKKEMKVKKELDKREQTTEVSEIEDQSKKKKEDMKTKKIDENQNSDVDDGSDDEDGNVSKKVSEYDKSLGIVKIAMAEETRRERLIQMQNELSIQSKPLNEWASTSIFEPKNIYKIVNKVPHLVQLTKCGRDQIKFNFNTMQEVELLSLPVIKKAQEVFCDGTEFVEYVIKSSNTYHEVSYDPNSFPTTTLHFAGYRASGMDGSGVDTERKQIDFLAGMLELCLKIGKAGNVIIQDVETEILSNIGHANNILSGLDGKTVLKDDFPSIIFSGIQHPLPWYTDMIEETFHADSYFIGETNVVERSHLTINKVKSVYGAMTDSLIATLVNIHDIQIGMKFRDVQYLMDILNLLKPHGSQISSKTDNDRMVFSIYIPNRDDSDRYVFCFYLSSTLRMHVFNELETRLLNSKGIKEDTLVNVISDIIPIDVQAQKSQLETVLSSHVQGLSLKHFHQMMVLEMNHVTVEPTFLGTTTYSSVYESSIHLLSIGVFALCFPATFWSNIGYFGCVIYNIWAFLDTMEYTRMMRDGYTNRIRNVRPLTRQEVREGDVPRIFLPRGVVPARMRRFLDAIRPVGRNIRIPAANEEWYPNCRNNPEIYVPFERIERTPISSLVRTPFSDRIMELCSVIRDLLKLWTDANSMPKGIKSPILSFLHALVLRAQSFGSTAHYEISILYQAVFLGPDIPLTIYSGNNEPCVFDKIGICSSQNFDYTGTIAIDNPMIHVGIGLFALLNIIPNSTVNRGLLTNKTEEDVPNFQFENPVNTFSRYSKMCRGMIEITEGFGILSIILSQSEDDQSPFRVFYNAFGRQIKSGMATQILKWTMRDDVLDIFKGKGVDGKGGGVHLDSRLRDPILSFLTAEGIHIPPTNANHERFSRPLTLLDPLDRLKYEVAMTTILSTNSPFHNFSQGVCFGSSTFESLSPTNRHPIEGYRIIDYVPNVTIVYERFAERTCVVFRNGGRAYKDPGTDGFPQRICLRIREPHLVQPPYWNFLELAVKFSKWLLEFPDVVYLANIQMGTLTASPNIMNMTNFERLRTLKPHNVIVVEFVDNTMDFSNPYTEVSLGCFEQSVCALKELRRNVVVSGIKGLSQQRFFQPPVPEMWEIGRDIKTGVPQNSQGVYKYESGIVNFNNFIPVWTSEAKFDEFPDTIFVPPLGTNL